MCRAYKVYAEIVMHYIVFFPSAKSSIVVIMQPGDLSSNAYKSY